ncbi:hypothetical protein OE88DRAFT_1755907 [Heliocybe sulcata]|uniref:Uncharacterized protein n=1 Tax=Heliocybe sulcata TaxID=5364 RepID=A0A5C3MWE3_9AGAM|nr:hypothetical protein OE88DRAFT_1755907 [Heliocybe sulcata]
MSAIRYSRECLFASLQRKIFTVDALPFSSPYIDYEKTSTGAINTSDLSLKRKSQVFRIRVGFTTRQLEPLSHSKTLSQLSSAICESRTTTSDKEKMAFAPISMNAMPLEIVEKIFVSATNIRRQQDRMRVLLMMTQVSRKVREILISKRDLWNFINTDNPALAALFLERAAEPDVSLVLTEHVDEERASEFFDVLELYSERIVSLHMDIPGALWEKLCTERVPEMWRMPSLLRAELWHQVGNDRYTIPPTVTLPFLTPGLEDLATFRIPLRAAQHMMSASIEHLSVSGGTKATAEDVWTALTATSNLRRLNICVAVVDDGTRRDVTLPHLEKLSLRFVNRPAAEVFTHLIHPGKACINLDIISDDLEEIRGIINTIGPKSNAIAIENDYTACTLSHYSTTHTTVVLSPPSARDASTAEEDGERGPKLELVIQQYIEEEEAFLYDALAEALGPTLDQIRALKIQDMRLYNDPSLEPTRHLIGPFPARLIRRKKLIWSTQEEIWVLACPDIHKMALRYVRFRKTFRDHNEDDFVDLLLRSIQHSQLGNEERNLTIDYLVNLKETDVADLEKTIYTIHWTGPTGKEDGGNMADDTVEIFGEREIGWLEEDDKSEEEAEDTDEDDSEEEDGVEDSL